MLGYRRITKGDFYRYGGFSNPRCVRVTRNKAWVYFTK